MGQIAGTMLTRDVDMKANEKTTFDPNVGFKSERMKRKMVACEEDLISAKIPPKFRDYCAHFLLNYQVCRYKNMPLLYKCAHERHEYLNCEHDDYVLRMKEFERERRLRLREKRLKEQQPQK